LSLLWVDLSPPIIHIHDRASITDGNSGSYGITSGSYNSTVALAPCQQCRFHALAGQLWALQGEFQQALAAQKHGTKPPAPDC